MWEKNRSRTDAHVPLYFLILLRRIILLSLSSRINVTIQQSQQQPWYIVDINPFKPNEISHSYQLDQCISVLRDTGWYSFHFYSFNRTFCKQTVETLIRLHQIVAKQMVQNYLMTCTLKWYQTWIELLIRNHATNFPNVPRIYRLNAFQYQ